MISVIQDNNLAQEHIERTGITVAKKNFFKSLYHFNKRRWANRNIEDFLLTPYGLYILGFPMTNYFDRLTCFYIDQKYGPPVQQKMKKGLNADASIFIPSVVRMNSCFNFNDIYHDEFLERVCFRCNKEFLMKLNGEYLTHEQCHYHWGKIELFKYSCCGGSLNSTGCSIGKLHVWAGYVDGLNGPFGEYVCTTWPEIIPYDFGVYALDCAMSFTANGQELTKVIVLRSDGELIYESFVKPDEEIIDYNSHISGVSAEHFSDPNNYKSLRTVQNDLLKFINCMTILVGYDVSKILRGLKLIHTRVIDMSICFKHRDGWASRYSLDDIISNILSRDRFEKRGNIENLLAIFELLMWLSLKYTRKEFLQEFSRETRQVTMSGDNWLNNPVYHFY